MFISYVTSPGPLKLAVVVITQAVTQYTYTYYWVSTLPLTNDVHVDINFDQSRNPDILF